MDKQILVDYIDACKVVDDTKEEIRKLKKNRKRILTDTVKGSSHDFPYTLQTYRTEGLAYSVVKDPDELDRLEVVLKERLRRLLSCRWRNGYQPFLRGCSGLSGTEFLRTFRGAR